MAVAVIMPRQGQSVESCILTEWYKEVGETVSKGDLLFAYETDKAAFEEESPEDGILLARFFDEGDEVPVLQNTAVVGAEGESFEEFRPDSQAADSADLPEEDKVDAPPAAAEAPPAAAEAPPAAAEAPPAAAEIPPTTAGIGPEGHPQPDRIESADKARISPRARKLAREKRVVFDQVAGTGPGGRIIERDIQAEIESGKRLTPLARKKLEGEGLVVPGKGRSPYGKITSRDLVEATQDKQASGDLQTAGKRAGDGRYTEVPLSNMRKIIAEGMYRSLQNSAQLTHHLGANASKMLQLRKIVKKKMEEGYTYNITLNDMVCYSVIRALKQFPDANAHFVGDRIRKFHKVNLGLAVDTERGLMVPALPDADDLSLPGLSSQLKKLSDSAKAGNISPDLLSPEAASFTVSNLGNYGVEMFTPVINLPQVAILGVNTIVQRPAVLDDGTFGFLPFIGLSLTYDHRAIDGGPATLFLAAIKKEIENLSPNYVN